MRVTAFSLGKIVLEWIIWFRVLLTKIIAQVQKILSTWIKMGCFQFADDTQQPKVHQKRDHHVEWAQMSLEENEHRLLLNCSTLFRLRGIGSQYTFPTKVWKSCKGTFMNECQSCYVQRFLAQLWRADVPHRKNKFQHTTVMNFKRREWIRYSQLRCSASHSFLMLRDVSCYILQKSSL